MPYITEEDRKRLQFLLDHMEKRVPKNAGELNYCITNLCIAYLKEHGKRYTTVNEIVGALECVKQEFYRRVAVPYEDGKIESNGDVY